MKRYSKITTLILTATLAVASGVQGSWACSCPVRDYGFLVPSNAVLPANTVGVPWWSTDQKVPEKSDFTVERLDREQAVSIDFELRVIQDPYKNDDYPYPYGHLVLVVPVNGFVSGAKYRLTSKDRHHLPPKVKEHLVDRSVVEVTISPREFDPTLGGATIEAGKSKYGRLTVSTRSGMCSTEIEAAAATILLLLPPDIEEWRNALLYTVIIDGETLWRPSKSLCDPIPPGLSWVGRGEELVFSWCRDERFGWPPDVNTDAGKHKIEFNAWLPGTDLIISASTEIELDCLEEEELYQQDNLTD